MITFMDQNEGNTIGIHVTGKLTDSDYKDVIIPRFEDLFNAHGALNVLFYMDKDFEGWDLKATWDDASYGLKHRADFNRLALVGGPEWVHWCIKLAGFLMKGEIKIFSLDELEEAWTWVKGGDS